MPASPWPPEPPASCASLPPCLYYYCFLLPRHTEDASSIPATATLQYLVAMQLPPPHGDSMYCDIQLPPPRRCVEVDLFEGNVKAARSTLHTQAGEAADGTCNQWGCTQVIDSYDYGFGYSYGGIDTSQPFDLAASFDHEGHMHVSVSQGERRRDMFDVRTAGNGGDGGVPEEASRAVRDALTSGMTLVTSLWGTNTPNGMSWLDGGCNVPCDVSQARVVFSNLRVEEEGR